MIGSDDGGTLKARSVESARAMRQVMRHDDEFAACRQTRFDQAPGAQSLLQAIEAVDEVGREIFDGLGVERLCRARRVEGDLSMKELVRFEIVRHHIELFEANAGALQAKLNGALRQAAGVVHADVADARQFFFFDGRHHATVLHERRSRVAFLSRYAEYIHQCLSVLNLNSYDKHLRATFSRQQSKGNDE
jgi:hypothetical protein